MAKRQSIVDCKWHPDREAWAEWSKTIKESPYGINWNRSYWGANNEPWSSIWLSALSDPLGDLFKDGLSIIDYGCGGGRYLDFLGQRLNSFTYYGLEKQSSKNTSTINELSEYFKDFDEVNFGFVDGDLGAEALKNADAIILGSIFTHLEFDNGSEDNSFVSICDKLINNNCATVFSAFIHDKYGLCGPDNMYGIENCYGKVFYTLKMIEDYCVDRGVKLTKCDSFFNRKTQEHHIFKIVS
jgi:SAM-dependent methyltransferase